MKVKTILVLLPAMSVALTSCGQVRKYEEHLGDYVYEMGYHSKFNVLQLTDIHWNYNSSTASSKQYLEKVLAEADKHVKAAQGNDAKIDLVEITGDQFMLANAYHVESFIKFFEKEAAAYGFMYTMIWGNHDRQGVYSPNWLADQCKKAKHCIYIEPNDNLYGRSNFVINLTKDGVSKWQLFNLDSGASFSETAVSPFRDYDYIRKDQTDWFVKEHAMLGETTPSVAYYHIPQQDNGIAYEKRKDLNNQFFKLEGFADNGNERYASNFISEGRKHGLKGAFMGHAHNVDWTYEEDGVIVGLGVKTGTELYFAHIDVNSTDEAMKEGLESIKEAGITENFDLIGASLVTLNDDEKFDLEHLYLNERTSGDFVKWVSWKY